MADSREENAQKRIFRMRFTFKNKKYDKDKQYYLVVYDEENSRVVIFEAKVAKSPEELPAACDAALRQIEVRQQAPDHPILWGVPETNYLKFFLFQVI